MKGEKRNERERERWKKDRRKQEWWKEDRMTKKTKLENMKGTGEIKEGKE